MDNKLKELLFFDFNGLSEDVCKSVSKILYGKQAYVDCVEFPWSDDGNEAKVKQQDAGLFFEKLETVDENDSIKQPKIHTSQIEEQFMTDVSVEHSVRLPEQPENNYSQNVHVNVDLTLKSSQPEFSPELPAQSVVNQPVHNKQFTDAPGGNPHVAQSINAGGMLPPQAMYVISHHSPNRPVSVLHQPPIPAHLPITGYNVPMGVARPTAHPYGNMMLAQPVHGIATVANTSPHPVSLPIHSRFLPPPQQLPMVSMHHPAINPTIHPQMQQAPISMQHSFQHYGSSEQHPVHKLYEKQYERRNKKRRPRSYYEGQIDEEQYSTNYPPAVLAQNIHSAYSDQRRTMQAEINNMVHLSETPCNVSTAINVSEQEKTVNLDYRTENESPPIEDINDTLVNCNIINNEEPPDNSGHTVCNADDSQRIEPQSVGNINNRAKDNGEREGKELIDFEFGFDLPKLAEQPFKSGDVYVFTSGDVYVLETGKKEEESKAQDYVESKNHANKDGNSLLKEIVDSEPRASDTNVTFGSQSLEVANKNITDNPSNQEQVEQANSKSQANASKVSWAGLFKSDSTASSGIIIYNKDNATEGMSNNVDMTPKVGIKDKAAVNDEEKLKPAQVKEDSETQKLARLFANMSVSHKTVSLRPRGLINRGNWCYINATLQALLACPPFYNLVKAMPTNPALTRGPSATPILDALTEFINEFTHMPLPKGPKGKRSQDVNPGTPFEPSYVYKMLQTIQSNQTFKQGRQEDAEEFLSCVLNGLHEEMLAVLKTLEENKEEGHVSNGYVASDGGEEEENAEESEEEEWQQVGPKNKSVITRAAKFAKSPISEVFGGQLRSALHKSGLKESATLQPFFTLQLDIQAENVWTLQDALEEFVSRESVQGYTCAKTKAEIEATRRLTIEELPPVLILHLKCFVYDKSGGCQKVIKQVDFSENMDINRELLSPNVRAKVPQGKRNYKLFAVVYHHGHKAVGGHYTADVYHSGINGWLRLDDSQVKVVTLQQVMKFNSPRVPYLLYYRRWDLV